MNVFDSFLFQISSPRWAPSKSTHTQTYIQIIARPLSRLPARRRNTLLSFSERKINTQSKRQDGYQQRIKMASCWLTVWKGQLFAKVSIFSLRWLINLFDWNQVPKNRVQLLQMLSRRQSLPTLRWTTISLLNNRNHSSQQQVMTTGLDVLSLSDCLSLFVPANPEPKPNILTTMNDLTLPRKMKSIGSNQRYIFLLDISPPSIRTRKRSDRCSEHEKNEGKSVGNGKLYFTGYFFIKGQRKLALLFWYLPSRTENGQTVTKGDRSIWSMISTKPMKLRRRRKRRPAIHPFNLANASNQSAVRLIVWKTIHRRYQPIYRCSIIWRGWMVGAFTSWSVWSLDKRD